MRPPGLLSSGVDKPRAARQPGPMRYFLDTEYNGWGGALLASRWFRRNGEELYLTLDCDCALDPWVERNVIPYLDMVPRRWSRRA